jgi:hypothetical protein
MNGWVWEEDAMKEEREEKATIVPDTKKGEE